MLDICLALQERLREHMGATLAVLGSVASLAALAGLPKVAPAAYVVPLSETPAQNASGDASTVVQMRGFALGVVLRVKHAGDASGTKAALALHELRTALSLAVLGWSFDPGTCTPMRFAGGSLLDSEAGFVSWQDDFEAERLHVHVEQLA